VTSGAPAAESACAPAGAPPAGRGEHYGRSCAALRPRLRREATPLPQPRSAPPSPCPLFPPKGTTPQVQEAEPASSLVPSRRVRIVGYDSPHVPKSRPWDTGGGTRPREFAGWGSGPWRASLCGTRGLHSEARARPSPHSRGPASCQNQAARTLRTHLVPRNWGSQNPSYFCSEKKNNV
jgi:hypothetical protein